VDGNNILEVYSRVSEIAKSVRENPRPVLLEFLTFRMRGHEEASGTKYVPQKLMDEWAAKDPIENFRQYLKGEEILSEDLDNQFHREIKEEIDINIQKAFEEEPISSTERDELDDVYYPYHYQHFEEDQKFENIRFTDAISQGLKQSMRRHESLVLMGQDIADYGGVFKITDGFIAEFGKERVRNTPICESGIVSTGMGLSINGMKAMVEMQFADFVSSGFNP